MPVSIPSISRREFLGRSFAAGAGFLLAPTAFSKRSVDADSWALFSDIHIAADPKKMARDINMTENFKTASQEVRSLSKRPSALLVCGDLAFNQGQTSDYAQITELLKPLRNHGLDLHLALGNHDHRERFWQSLKKEKFRKSVADKQAAIFSTRHANWFVLDSLQKTLQTPGSLGETQRLWLAKALDLNPKKPAIIVIHHNPSDRPGGLEDAEELFAIIRPRKQVKAYIFGHTHNWNVRQDESGIHLINLPPTSYVFNSSQPSGWVNAKMQADSLNLELRCIDKSHAQHGQKLALKWRA